MNIAKLFAHLATDMCNVARRLWGDDNRGITLPTLQTSSEQPEESTSIVKEKNSTIEQEVLTAHEIENNTLASRLLDERQQEFLHGWSDRYFPENVNDCLYSKYKNWKFKCDLDVIVLNNVRIQANEGGPYSPSVVPALVPRVPLNIEYI